MPPPYPSPGPPPPICDGILSVVAHSGECGGVDTRHEPATPCSIFLTPFFLAASLCFPSLHFFRVRKGDRDPLGHEVRGYEVHECHRSGYTRPSLPFRHRVQKCSRLTSGTANRLAGIVW